MEREPTIIVGLWNRVAERPVVRALAILAAVDWLALVLLTVIGQLDGVVAAALVVCSMVWFFLVLAWYPLLHPLLQASFGKPGERAGLFCEQMAIGTLAGMLVIWALYVPIIFFRA